MINHSARITDLEICGINIFGIPSYGTGKGYITSFTICNKKNNYNNDFCSKISPKKSTGNPIHNAMLTKCKNKIYFQ